MASPLKKRRTGYGHSTLGTFENRREQKQLQLKSRFESIFEKYEKDFTGIGDEIDLETGRFHVDNGHIQRMKYERDVGDGENNQIIRFEEDEQSDAGSGVSDEGTSNESEPRSDGLVMDFGASAIAAPQQDYEDLDDADELANSVIRVRKAVKNCHKGMKSDASGPVDHTRAAGGLVQIPKGACRDEQGKLVERKWIAPPLPKASRPRRVIIPGPFRIHDLNLDLGDWSHEDSIWDARPGSKPNAALNTIDGYARNGDGDGEPNTLDWTKADFNLLYNLKTRTTLSDERIAQLLGKSASAVGPVWQRIHSVRDQNRGSRSTAKSLDELFKPKCEDEDDIAAAPTAAGAISSRSDLPHEIPDSDPLGSITGTQERPIEIDCMSSSSDAENDECASASQLGQTTTSNAALDTIIASGTHVEKDPAVTETSGVIRIEPTSPKGLGTTSSKLSTFNEGNKASPSKAREIPDSQPPQLGSSQFERSPITLPFEGILDSEGSHDVLKTPGKLPRPRFKWQSLTPSRTKLKERRTARHVSPHSEKTSKSAPNSVRKTFTASSPLVDTRQSHVLADDGKDDDICVKGPRTPIIVAKRQSTGGSGKRSALRAAMQNCSDDELG